MSAEPEKSERPDAVWMKPTSASPACRYSYDARKGKLWQGRRMFSDCGIWCTLFDRAAAAKAVGIGEHCVHCLTGNRISTVGVNFVDTKKRLKRRRRGGLMPDVGVF